MNSPFLILYFIFCTLSVRKKTFSKALKKSIISFAWNVTKKSINYPLINHLTPPYHFFFFCLFFYCKHFPSPKELFMLQLSTTVKLSQHS